MTFAEAFYKHQIGLSDIDDYVTEWHEGDSQLPLSEYLGLTLDEYKLMVENFDKFKIQMLYNRSDHDKTVIYYSPPIDESPIRKIPCNCRKSMAELVYKDIVFENWTIKNAPTWYCSKCGREYIIQKDIRKNIINKVERVKKENNGSIN